MSLNEAEFSALRETISRRGTVRVVLLPVTVVAWAALVAVLMLFGDLPILALSSLAILAAGFEAIHTLHVGVERIGRYVQVYYEDGNGTPQWETTAMAIGPPLPGGGVDPLFTIVFLCGIAVNMLAAWLPEPTPVELLVIGALHAGLAVRMIRARAAAGRQRATELAAFRGHRMGELSSKT